MDSGIPILEKDQNFIVTSEPVCSKPHEHQHFILKAPLLLASYHGFWKVLEQVIEFIERKEHEPSFNDMEENNPYYFLTTHTSENILHLILKGPSLTDTQVENGFHNSQFTTLTTFYLGFKPFLNITLIFNYILGHKW